MRSFTPAAGRPNRTRRDFLKDATLASTVASIGLANPAQALEARAVPADSPTSLTSLSAVAALAAMRHGDISAEAYATALLARAGALQSLNAFISLQPEQVLEAARHADLARRRGSALGPLHGLPIPVKDSVNTRQLPTTAGTAALRHFQPDDDAPVLQKLFSNGAYLYGKTNLHELSLGYTTNNATYGACRNPYDPTHSPGGSSGGSAVAVAAHLAPLAVAEDTLGSIRVPAAVCGLAGMRPTTGRYPMGGVMPITPRFDMVGAVARTVEDLVLFDTVLGPDQTPLRRRALRGIRLGVPAFQWSGLDPEVERIGRLGLERLRDAGAVLVPGDVPAPMTIGFEIVSTINAYEVVANEAAYLERYHAQLTFDTFTAQMSPLLRNRFLTTFKRGMPEAVTTASYDDALRQLAALRAAVPAYFREQRIAALVFPTTLRPGVALGEEVETSVGGKLLPVRLAMARNVAMGSCAALPGLNLPAGLTDGSLPVGLEFDMLSGEDRQLLSLGLSLEHALGPIEPPKLG